MGFGHRVYKTYDPRAKIMKKVCDEVLEHVGIRSVNCKTWCSEQGYKRAVLPLLPYGRSCSTTPCIQCVWHVLDTELPKADELPLSLLHSYNAVQHTGILLDWTACMWSMLAYRCLHLACRDELLEVAVELEHVATSDEYFVKRGLYPNVDFYSGIVLRAMGIPVSM